MKRSVIFHGHFYQPPRVNPWSGTMERQETASPADNWNERIYHECYLPNTEAIIKSPEGYYEEVNNFEYISFDMGPTLSNWLAENYIDTYRSIVEADWKENNAIAVPYNHTILPLDNGIIRHAQIAWGIQEFEMRYKRFPAGMWLPECAVSYEVAEDLVKAGMKFLILTQGQAKSVKRLYGRHLYYVSGDKLDIRHPYRLETGAGYIDVFFSHNELSTDISFKRLLENPVECANRIERIFGEKHSEDLLVTIVTDGETFGHHQKGTEKGLAYLLKYELPSRGIEVTTFEKYLREHTVGWGVRIKDNTSWSCYHGIERWKSDCGCGAEEGSDLEWRKPLRESLTWLSERIIEIYMEKGKKYFINSPWDAVNNYGRVLTDCSKIKEFHCNYVNDEYRHNIEVNKIMELIHFSFYMFTSCGWFFGSLSRIEPVQNLSFALRAIELVKELWNIDLEKEFCDKLNEYPDARYVWNGIVKNRRVKPEEIAKDFWEVYRYTGINRNKRGDWHLEMIEEEKVKMENCRTGAGFTFQFNDENH